MHSLQLPLVVSIASNSASAFVSIPHSKTIDVSRSIYPSTSVSLQHINCYKRNGYRRKSCRNYVDCRSSSSTSLSASISAVTTSISGFYKTSPLLAGVIVGLFSRLIHYTSRKDTKSFSLNIKHNNNTNFAIIRVLCSGLVLGILFEIVVHGSIIFSLRE